jgi:four helix bundle protein
MRSTGATGDSEAKAAQSTRDFISKYEIALKEIHEFKFWIEVFIEAGLIPAPKFSALLEEANTIASILAASIKKLKENLS